MLRYGAFVSLGLLLAWGALLVFLATGRLKTAAFGTASTFLALMVPFFWLAPEITELTIGQVGSLKTNVQQATQYLDEIKQIRDKLKSQDEALTSSVQALNDKIASTETSLKAQSDAAAKSMKTLDDEIAGARRESDEAREVARDIMAAQQHLFDRRLTPVQTQAIAASLRKFSGNAQATLRFCGTEECNAFATALANILRDAKWSISDEQKDDTISARGVSVSTSGDTICMNRAAAETLAESLNSNRIETELPPVKSFDMCETDVHIAIGPAH